MSFPSFVRIPLVVFRHLCRSQSNIFLIYVLETTGNCVEFTSLRINYFNERQSLLLVRLLQEGSINSKRFAIALEAILKSTFSRVIGLQFVSSKSVPSSFGVNVIIPLHWEIPSSPFIWELLLTLLLHKVTLKSLENTTIY